MRIVEQVKKTIELYEMVRPNDALIVAVSGGPDSVFLFHAMNRIREKLRLRIYVCHLNHGLRGKESDEDARFVKKLAGESQVPFIQKKIALTTEGNRHISLEERAREVRYEYFVSTAKKVEAQSIATGHTLDDQAETVMMRIIKGTSVRGLSGIPPVREELGIRIIRPLIEIERRQIEEYLRKEGIPFRVDRTNAEEIFFRNVVRRRILPYLEQFNPRIKRSLFNFAQHVREDREFIESARRLASGRVIAKGDRGTEILLGEMVIQPRALQKEILRDALERAGGNIKKLTYRHWKDMENFIRFKRKGQSIDLPGGIRVSRTEKALIFEKKQ